MGRYHVLKELLSGELAKRVQVTGVVTDDPTKAFTLPRFGSGNTPTTGTTR